MDGTKGPQTQAEAKKFLAQEALAAITNIEDMRYLWYHYQDWPKRKRKNFDKVHNDIIARIKKWGKLD